MAKNEKIETLFRAALSATPTERTQSSDLSTGFDEALKTWEVIVKYNGSLSPLTDKYPGLIFYELLGQYGVLMVPEAYIDAIAAEAFITYMEKPKALFYESTPGATASCVTALQNRLPNLTGKGILVGIIDSGIDYTHPDFQDENGSRILYLWDQTLNSLYPQELLTQALENPSLCPSRDTSGHGTHVAGIAAGNGRASSGVNRGVAYESILLVVKLGTPSPQGFPNTAQLMLGIDFCVRESIRRNQPLALNLSFGNTYGSHSGTSLLETYLNTVSQLGQISILIGSGNEGASAGHTQGILKSGQSATIPFTISDYTPTLNLQLWKNYWDEFLVQLQPPTGNAISLPWQEGSWRYPLGETDLYAFVGSPTPYSPLQEIYLDLLPRDSYITPGVWSLRLIPQRIRQGRFDVWMPSSALRGNQSAFLYPTPETTLTIPSTAFLPITVAAYDSASNTYANFSGRGFTREDRVAKPDLAAPGVDIISCSPGGGYEMRTGTSMATPFVTGSAALLMQWGILEGNDPFLYGEKLKAYLINGTRTLPGITEYPSREIGWGVLCVNDSIS